MFKEEILGKYFNNLRRILRYKQETLDYYEQIIRFQELQSRATYNLFFEKPVTFILRGIIYLPTHVLRYFNRLADKYYLSKLRKEVDILKIEIKYVQKTRWTKLAK